MIDWTQAPTWAKGYVVVFKRKPRWVSVPKMREFSSYTKVAAAPMFDVETGVFHPRPLVHGPALEEVDMVSSPPHYRQGGIECIEAIKAALSPEEYAGYLRGNCLKYLWRTNHKGGAEDLAKCQWYLDRLINLRTQKTGTGV